MRYPNIYSLFRERVGQYAGRDVFYVREGDGWRGISWERFDREAHAFASALLASGLGRGAAVCVLMGNVPEWPVCDLGIVAAGGISCGLYPTSSAEQCRYIVNHSDAEFVVVDTAAQKLAWLSLKPVTGRTHQLRAHAAHIGHPIVGDPKYFDIENWELPGGLQQRLHLLARRIVIPHPRTGSPIDVTAPLPPHMQQSFNLLGFETDRYDPIVDAPEE